MDKLKFRNPEPQNGRRDFAKKWPIFGQFWWKLVPTKIALESRQMMQKFKFYTISKIYQMIYRMHLKSQKKIILIFFYSQKTFSGQTIFLVKKWAKVRKLTKKWPKWPKIPKNQNLQNASNSTFMHSKPRFSKFWGLKTRF